VTSATLGNSIAALGNSAVRIRSPSVPDLPVSFHSLPNLFLTLPTADPPVPLHSGLTPGGVCERGVGPTGQNGSGGEKR
jgi:hypothetical protein